MKTSGVLPRLPGERAVRYTTTACYLEVELHGFGIHKSRFFGGRLETHPFFSREALHCALRDEWSEAQPQVYEPIRIPYQSTPLFAEDPQIVEIQYSAEDGHTKKSASNPVSLAGLSSGTMESMAPGTVLRAAVWGDPDHLPPIEEGRGFYIGKGRSPAVVRRCHVQRVQVERKALGRNSLPIQIPLERMPQIQAMGLGFRPIARTRRYLLLQLASGSVLDCFEIEGLRVPVL